MKCIKSKFHITNNELHEYINYYVQKSKSEFAEMEWHTYWLVNYFKNKPIFYQWENPKLRDKFYFRKLQLELEKLSENKNDMIC